MGGCESVPVNATDLYPAVKPQYLCALKVIVGTICMASILGALLIIAVYICGVRSRVRYIVVCISVADILVAWAHIWGISSHYERSFNAYRSANSSEHYADTGCAVQATLAVYGTLASFLWTVALAWFVFFSLCCPCTKCLPGTALSVFIAHIFCWGAPLAVITWLGEGSQLGFSRGISVAWCYTHTPQEKQFLVILTILFSYELWSYVTFLLLLFFSIVTCLCYGICCTQKCKPKRSAGQMQNENSQARYMRQEDGAERSESVSLTGPVDYGGTAQHVKRVVPDETEQEREEKLSSADISLFSVVFTLLILRVPSVILDSVGLNALATSSEQLESIYKSQAIAAAVFLAGIGNSAQGAVNAVLFLVGPILFKRCKKCCGVKID